MPKTEADIIGRNPLVAKMKKIREAANKQAMPSARYIARLKTILLCLDCMPEIRNVVIKIIAPIADVAPVIVLIHSGEVECQ
ncbi:hypothetical protein ACFL3E_02480 [Patescibacteria group bacterium]